MSHWNLLVLVQVIWLQQVASIFHTRPWRQLAEKRVLYMWRVDVSLLCFQKLRHFEFHDYQRILLAHSCTKSSRFHLDTIHNFFYSLYSSKPLYLHCSIVSAPPKTDTLGLCLCTLKYINKVFKCSKLLSPSLGSLRFEGSNVNGNATNQWFDWLNE